MIKPKIITDKTLVDNIKLDPNTTAVTDPNDPFWNDFDFEAILEAMKLENPKIYAALNNMSKEQLREILAMSGSIYQHRVFTTS